MIIGKIKKFIIWTLVAVFMGGTFLGTLNLNPQKAKAAEFVDNGYGHFVTCDTPVHTKDLFGIASGNYDDVYYDHTSIVNNGKTMEIIYSIGSANYKKIFEYLTTKKGSNEDTIIYYVNKDTNPVTYMRIKKDPKIYDEYYSVTVTKNLDPDDPTTYIPSPINTDYEKFIHFLNKQDNRHGGDIPANENNPCRVFKGEALTATIKPGADITKDAPIITLAAWPEGFRPAMQFKLTHYIHTDGSGENREVFYFTYQQSASGIREERFANLAIKVLSNARALAVDYGDIKNYQDDSNSHKKLHLLTGHADVNLDKNEVYENLLNRAYNMKATGGDNTCGGVVGPNGPNEISNWTDQPRTVCLNVSSTGYLSAWGVTGNEGSLTNPTGEDDTCGYKSTGIIGRAIAGAICEFIKAIGDLAAWLVNSVFGDAFNAYHNKDTLVAATSILNPFFIKRAQAVEAVNYKAELDRDTKAVNLSWDAIPDAKFYLLTRNGEDLATLVTTSYSDTTAPDGDIVYTITAQDASHNVLATVETTKLTKSSSGITSSADLNASSIKNALDGEPPWVLKAWKVMLGLANVFVVITLLFLAITNILHIQYDTYNIKKALPTLIIGVILANFSILIAKMLVDAANILTATFMGGDAGEGVKRLITAVIPSSTSTGQPGYSFVGTTSMGGLIMSLFFSGFALVVFLILGFLFYIRYAVIVALTVVAPLAFVLMAFPPTQSFFKQWWGWYAKFIFLKPVSLFCIWLATLALEASGGKNITAWAVSVFMCIAAIIVPFKMGGAVMGAWGGFGKWATGTGKQGYLRKPADNFVQGKKDAWKERANLGLERHTSIGARREQHAAKMKELKDEREANTAKLENERRARSGGRVESEEQRRERMKKDLERGKNQRNKEFIESEEGKRIVEEEIEDTVATGELEIAKRGQTFAIYQEEGKGRRLADFESDFANSELRIEKMKDDAKRTIAGEHIRKHSLVPVEIRKPMEDLEVAQERLAKSEVGTTEHTQALADIATHQTALAHAEATLRASGTTQEQINEHKRNVLPRLERTRNYAIINKSAYADATDEASSKSPVNLAKSIKSMGKTNSVGAFAWNEADAKKFFQDGTTTTADAAQGLGTEVAALQITLKDQKTMGVAFQGYADVLQEHNPAFLQEAAKRMEERADPKTVDKIKASIKRQIVGSDGRITAENLSKVTLDTAGDYDIQGFVNGIVLELQKADDDGGFTDDTGALTVKGNSGLGRNVAASVAKSGS